MKIYFSGIGGIGMSAIAQISFLLGNQVLGSDIKPSYITDKLQEMGIKIFFHQQEENITQDINLFVYSSAIDKDNPEYKQAEKLNIPILHRSQYLKEILKNKKVISITGSSGKTTTTTLTGMILNNLSIPVNLITGGWIKELNSNIIWNDSEWVVLEADESDGSLLNYHSNIGLITDLAVDVNLSSQTFRQLNTSINPSNLKQKLKEIYKEFIEKINKIQGKIIISNDQELLNFINQNNFKVDIIFGSSFEKFDLPYFFFDDFNQFEVKGFPYVEFRLKALIKNSLYDLGNLKLSTIGKYNVLNFTACASVVFALTQNLNYLKNLTNIDLNSIQLPKRRFEILFNDIVNNNRLIVVDDYAHNPKKIKSLINDLNIVYHNYQRIVVFQPHRYTRTMMFWDKLKEVFNNLDYLIILPIYEAGEKPIENINSQNLTNLIKQQKNNIKEVKYIESFQKTIDFLEEKIKYKDTIIVFVGAGNITNLANQWANDLFQLSKTIV